MEKSTNMNDQKFSDITSTSLHIGGIKVKFPVKPYPSQLSMMSRIIRGLEKKQHCLLESPTGSGKSLALLCSAIAWQQAQREKFDDNIIAGLKPCSVKLDLQCTCQKAVMSSTYDTSKYFDKNADKDKSVVEISSNSDEDDFRPTKKTPSQSVPKPKPTETCDACLHKEEEEYKLAMEEGYKKPRVPKIWFGTRTHKQIAQITKELGRTAYKATRMTILSSRQHSCIHPAVMKSSNKNEECKELRMGTHLSGAKCAFYHNVHRMKNHHQLNCAGMNKAWDLEELIGLGKTIKACPFYSARELISSSDIVFCPYNYLIDPMIRSQMQINPNNQVIIMDEAHNIEDSARNAGSFTMIEESLANATADLQYLINDGVKLDDHRPLHLLCSNVGQWIGEHSRNLKSSDYEMSSDVWCGRDIVDHLKEWGITQDTLPLLQGNYTSAIDISGEENPENAKVLHSSSQALLGGLFNVLRYLMNEDNKYCDDYRITILKQPVFKVPPPKRTKDGWFNLNKKPKKRFETTLNFWCLNPSVAFGDLKQAHCIILTSGTLSPMSSFSSELGLSFPIQLEANHVIKDSQVWVGAIGCGPKGIELEATYKNTDRFDFQDELGEVVLQVCQTVPHGILCFFSSYGMLQKLQQRWQSTGLWHKLEEIKCVVCEPRSSVKEEFESLLNSFYDAIKESEKDNTGGGLMFAVCRGKVSEGLDFADNNARAVITVGIPFPSIKDKQVELKRRYNDMHKARRGLLSGGQWYEIQAYRAMNQALGRCIRHRDDWGALIIVDHRFCKNPMRYSKGLSKWVRQKMNSYPVYQNGHANLKAFVEKWVSESAHQAILLEESSESIAESEPTLPDSSPVKTVSGITVNTSHTQQVNMIQFDTLSTRTKTILGERRPVNILESEQVHPSEDIQDTPKENLLEIFQSPMPLKCCIKGTEDSPTVTAPVKSGKGDKKCKFRSPTNRLLSYGPKEEVEEDYFNDTIAASPEGNITIIPESPTSETKVPPKDAEITLERARQQLEFAGPTTVNTVETKKRKQAEVLPSDHEELTIAEEATDAATCNSGELLPRRKRMKKKAEKVDL